MKSNKIKQLAVKGLANGKLKLGRVRPKSIGFFWNKGVTMYGAPRPVMMSELELKLAYNKDNFIELPAVWDGSNSTKDVVYVPIHDEATPVNLTICEIPGLRPMSNEEMLNSLKAGHRPAVMGQEHLMQEVLNHGSEVMSTMMTTIHSKLYSDGDWDGDSFITTLSPELEGKSKPFINCDDASSIYNNLTLDPTPITEEELQWHKTTMHDLFTPQELAEQWEEDNTFLLNTATTYYINIAEGYILIDNRKYKFELEDVSLRLDVDGDWVSTHVESKNLVCYASVSIGTIIYKEIKILGEL